jgi:uncharacterized damage-inducible protein DinB
METVQTTTGLLDILRLHTKLFNNVLEGIESEKETERVNGSTNHLRWLAAHIVSTRYFIGQMAGMEIEEPHFDIIGQGKALDESIDYPTLEESLKDWNAIAEKVEEGLQNASEETLGAKPPFEFPAVDNTILGAISFMVHHEAYHLGQMGFIRKCQGNEAMKY